MGRREFSGLRVLIGRMVGREKDVPVGHGVLRGVLKEVRLFSFQFSLTFQVVEVRVESDFAEGDDDAQVC